MIKHMLARATLVLLLLCWVPLAVAADGYRVIDAATAGDDPDTVQVTEFFWYGCPHCYRFLPYMDRWLEDQPDDVEFRRMPAVFSSSWAVHGRAYYAAEVLDVLDRFHAAMFRAMHEDGQRFRTTESIGAFVATLDIDREEFVDTMDSFAVDSRMRRARSLQESYGIAGTPSVVIDGRYVTSGSEAGSFDRMLQVIDDRVAASRRDGG